MLLDRLKEGLKAYIGNRKAVVGVHGDLYSTAAAVLCAESIGRNHTVCVVPYIRLNDELHIVKEALQDKQLDVRLVDISKMLTELTSSCYFEDGTSNMDALRMRGSLLGGAALRYMASCMGAVVVSPITRDHRMVGAIAVGEYLADVAPFWNMHVSEVYARALDLGVSKAAPDRIVDPDFHEEHGFDLRDVVDVVDRFDHDQYRDADGNMVLMHTMPWPTRIIYRRTDGGWGPVQLTDAEKAVIVEHNKNVASIRKLMLDTVDLGGA